MILFDSDCDPVVDTPLVVVSSEGFFVFTLEVNHVAFQLSCKLKLPKLDYSYTSFAVVVKVSIFQGSQGKWLTSMKGTLTTLLLLRC